MKNRYFFRGDRVFHINRGPGEFENYTEDYESCFVKFDETGESDKVTVSFLTYEKKDLSMEVATHTGERLKTRGHCEKCRTLTNWVVDVSGRVAYWCGCD